MIHISFMKKEEKLFYKKLSLSFFLGYSGFDKFIFKKFKKGIERFILFFISLISIFYYQKILKFISSSTERVIFFTRKFFNFSSLVLSTHFPRAIGLLFLTFLTFVFLASVFLAYILWINDFVKILKREDFD